CVAENELRTRRINGGEIKPLVPVEDSIRRDSSTRPRRAGWHRAGRILACGSDQSYKAQDYKRSHRTSSGRIAARQGKSRLGFSRSTTQKNQPSIRQLGGRGVLRGV